MRRWREDPGGGAALRRVRRWREDPRGGAALRRVRRWREDPVDGTALRPVTGMQTDLCPSLCWESVGVQVSTRRLES